ncbi:MAG: IS21 family transposase [Acidobacteriota bacterium]
MHRLLQEGLTKAEVARRLGRSRQTLYNWIQRDRIVKDAGAPEKPTHRPSKLEPYKPYLDSRLERFDIPATVLLKEIRKKGYAGGITILREYVAKVKKRHVRSVVDRFETEPGRQAQVDWGSCGILEHDGRRRRLSLFVLVLGYSRVIWARFVVSEQRPVMLGLLEDAFEGIGGVPKELLIDNMKQAVEAARTREKPAVIQPAFQSFADHWGFEVVACPPYWPRAKGKVERAVDYLKRSFLEGRRFTDLEDLNAQLRVWLSETANVRLHGTLKERPADRLKTDQAAFRPLVDRTPFPAAERSVRRSDHDARISYGGVHYSVDPKILGGRRGVEVEVLIGADQRLRIYHLGQLVGEHPLAPSGSPPQDDALHAAARRALRERASMEAPRGKAPRFEQLQGLEAESLRHGAPSVETRDLTTYEEASHAG